MSLSRMLTCKAIVFILVENCKLSEAVTCAVSIKSVVGQQMRQAGSRRPNRYPRAHCSRSQRTYENAPSLIVPIIESSGYCIW